MKSRTPTVCGLALLMTACGGTAEPPAAADGIVLVESTEPLWTSGDQWRLADEPSLSIGVEEGDEPYMFYRIGSVLPLGDGRIVVSDWGHTEIRFFDADGTFIRSVGRRGQGPGEYGEFSSMRLYGPTPDGRILVNDRVNGRVNVIDLNGDYVGQIENQSSPGATGAEIAALFGDGSWMVTAVDGDNALRGDPGTIISMRYQHLRYSAAGEPIGLVASTAARRRFVNAIPGVTHYPFVPFEPDADVVPVGGLLWVSTGADPEVVAYDFDGREARRVRWEIADRQRTADVFDRYRDENLAQMEGRQLAQYTHLYAQDLPMREFVPSHQALLADAAGNLWLERFRLPWENQPRWDVVSPEQGWLGVITIPEGFAVQRITEDSIIGMHRDEAGVSRVQIRPLNK